MYGFFNLIAWSSKFVGSSFMHTYLKSPFPLKLSELFGREFFVVIMPMTMPTTGVNQHRVANGGEGRGE